MTYTFAEAKQSLAPFAGTRGLLDLSSAVNEAIDALTKSRNWQRMRKVMRFTLTEGGYFALPQDCGALLRAAVDGEAVSIHGQDHEFLSAGPGDYDFVAQGLAPLHGIQRLGIYPTMNGLSAASTLVAYSTSVPGGSVKVQGKNADGDIVTALVPCAQWTGPDDIDTLVAADATATSTVFTEILKVTVPSDATAYISLYGIADAEFTFLSRMHPKIRVPEFTRYRLPGFSSLTDASYRLLAECAIRFLPLVDDDEPIPFDSLRPVQYMLQSFWNMDSGETKAADDFRARAELALLINEGAENERQSMQILNPLYTGSNGEATASWENC